MRRARLVELVAELIRASIRSRRDRLNPMPPTAAARAVCAAFMIATMKPWNAINVRSLHGRPAIHGNSHAVWVAPYGVNPVKSVIHEIRKAMTGLVRGERIAADSIRSEPVGVYAASSLRASHGSGRRCTPMRLAVRGASQSPLHDSAMRGAIHGFSLH